MTAESTRDWVKAVLERWEAPLVSYARGILGDLERSRDVCQETFLELCRQPREKVEPRLRPWLFTVCRNKALDVLRKEKRMTAIDTDKQLESPEPAPGAATENRESVGQVLAAVAKLPERQREVLRLKFQSGLTYREIGEITGDSVSNVGVLLHNALKTLRGTVTL